MKTSLDTNFSIEERKPIWIALSRFYLDNELQDHDFKYIASKINESPYSFSEVKQIDKEEVFPVLYSNLLHLTGVWSGFEDDWLIIEIDKKLKKRNAFNQCANAWKYCGVKWMYSKYWKKLNTAYQSLNIAS